VIKHHWEQ